MSKLTIQKRISLITPTNLNVDSTWLNKKPVGNELWEYEK
jgi:hypothetical protein